MLLALASVMLPDKLAAVPLLLMSAPPELMPVPLSVTASAPIVWPFRSNTAPLETVVPLAVLPSAVALPSCSVPALTVVAPP